MNPSILGGIIVDFGDKTIDLSVASRVNKLNGLLSGSRFFWRLFFSRLTALVFFRIRMIMLVVRER